MENTAEVKAVLESYIKERIELEEKSIGQIATYAIVRSAGGVFSLSIYWNGQIKKGSKTRLTFEMGTEPQVGSVAIKVMEKILKEDKKIGVLDRIMREKEKELTDKQATGAAQWDLSKVL